MHKEVKCCRLGCIAEGTTLIILQNDLIGVSVGCEKGPIASPLLTLLQTDTLESLVCLCTGGACSRLEPALDTHIEMCFMHAGCMLSGLTPVLADNVM